MPLPRLLKTSSRWVKGPVNRQDPNSNPLGQRFPEGAAGTPSKPKAPQEKSGGLMSVKPYFPSFARFIAPCPVWKSLYR